MINQQSKIKNLIANNSVFLALCLLLIIALGLALLCIPKGELHLLLCDHHTPARDIFYRYYTHVAEWFPYVLCVLILLFGRIGDGLMASSCMIFSALTTQLFKHILVEPRPLMWFSQNMPHIQLPLVDGVKMNLWLSFPSGHTTSFFALAFVASILLTKLLSAKRSNSDNGLTGVAGLTAVCGLLQATLFLLAALGGYSRIYLSQHFAADVLAGIVSGVCISIVCYAIFSRYEDKKWYNYRLITKK